MSHKVSSCEVVIAGGGAIGAACARAAALHGLHTIVCEPGPDPAAATAASAGMLAAQIESADDPLRALAVRARDRYDLLAPALRETTGIDIGLWRDGIAWVAFDETRAAALQTIVAEQRQAGLRCDWLDAAELAARFPGAAPCVGALFAPEDGAIDAPALGRGLLADARRLGVEVRPEPVRNIVITGDRAGGVETPGGTIDAHHVIIAAGPWSPRIGGLRRTLPVEPVRGQMLATAWPARMPRAILYSDHAYVLARGDEALLGSTMERVGFDGRVTPSGLAEVRAAADRLVPELAGTPARRSWAGLRPVTPDGRPILGADPAVGGLWYATGHGRNGILLAALTGEIIGTLLAGGAPDIDLTPFAATRFSTEGSNQPFS